MRGVAGLNQILQGLAVAQRAQVADMNEKDLAREIKRLEKLMLDHARNLEFEKVALVQDQLAISKEQVFGAAGHDPVVVGRG